MQLETFGLADAQLSTDVEYALYPGGAGSGAKHCEARPCHGHYAAAHLLSGELTLVVDDNGVGFDPAVPGAGAGIGLHDTAGRVAYLGGELLMDSSPGRGTTLTAIVPLPASAGEWYLCRNLNINLLYLLRPWSGKALCL